MTQEETAAGHQHVGTETVESVVRAQLSKALGGKRGMLEAAVPTTLPTAIAAAEIARSLGPRLPELLDDKARKAVLGAGLATGGRSWLDRLMAAVGGRAPLRVTDEGT